MFYMDIQTFDRDFERRLTTASREVRLIRAIPAEIRTGTEGKAELIYQGPDEKRVVEPYDLVVLSVGMSPDEAVGPLAALVGVEPNQDAFCGQEGEEVATQTRGVFVAGAVQGPRSIEESVSHAIRTAGEVATYVKGLRRSENQ
jgi:heterodisulfide reductase subunit A